MLRNLHRLLALSPPSWRCSQRCATNAAARNKIKYTDTINLPKSKFPPRLTAAKRAEVELHINKSCFADLYQWQRRHLRNAADDDDEFVLHDGPPYANGDLHMGHAINKILKDIVLRQNVIRGRRVHYRPGWDCHGLPIELKALGSADDDANRQPLDIRRKARSFAAQTIGKQRDAFAAWGVMADWREPRESYRTMDASYVRNQLRMFQRLYAGGFVYRDMKPVYWSPSSRTALAEAELEYDAHYVSPSLTLRLRFARVPQALRSLVQTAQLYALIWTTTPWSLAANQAVCVNAELRYSVVRLRGHAASDLYVIGSDLIAESGLDVEAVLAQFSGRDLIDGEYFHPLDRSESLPIFAAAHVQATKGTGLVHTAPAHGPDDFLVSLEQNIQLKSLVDADGMYNAHAPDFLRGHEVLEAGNRLVLDRVRDDIVQLAQIEHSYPIDWRTKKPVLIRASEQWFINTARIKDAAIEEIDRVAVYPPRTAAVNKTNLVNQLRRRPYWCISRQRAWGTPIPVFYNRRTAAQIVDSRIVDHLCELLRAPGAAADLWWTLSVGELIPAEVLSDLHLKAADVRKGEDILDIWFDSGISWSYALDANVADGRRVADLYLEGHDQFTGWFQSSLMTSVAAQQCAPYRALFVHGFAVDETGAKMSKSLGNSIVPADIIGQHGVDTLRWWVAHHATQHTSIPVAQPTLLGAAECVQKCRATLKYLVGCVGGIERPPEAPSADATGLRIVDKHFLNALAEFEADIATLYRSHQYNRAAASIVHFVSNEMSAAYLHLIKDRLYCGTTAEHESLRRVLYVAYVTLSRALWPITPFLVEECWSYFDAKPFYAMAALSQTRVRPDNAHSDLIDMVQLLKQQLNQSVRDTNTWTLNATVSGPPKLLDRLGALQTQRLRPQHDSELCELLQVGSCTLLPDDDGCSECTVSTQRIEGTLCARCRRFSVVEASAVCDRCAAVLKEKC